jgi:hypothetical protein
MRERTEEMATAPAPAPITESLDHASSARSITTYNWRAHWLTVREFGRMMGRDEQTIYKWLRNGTLAEFGVPVCQFRHGRLHSGRTFIQNIY